MSVIRSQSLLVEGGEEQASEFLRFAEAADKFFPTQLVTAAGGEGQEGGKVVTLSYLRVELGRVRSGMADFLIRVSTPQTEGAKKSNVMVTIRGSKTFANPAGANKIAKVIAKQMAARGDDTHNWGQANVEHLGQMLLAPLKFFAGNIHMSLLRFSTEALS